MSVNIHIRFLNDICISLADLGEDCGGYIPPGRKILPKKVMIWTANPPPPHQNFLDPPMYTQKIDIYLPKIRKNTRPTEYSVTV